MSDHIFIRVETATDDITCCLDCAQSSGLLRSFRSFIVVRSANKRTTAITANLFPLWRWRGGAQPSVETALVFYHRSSPMSQLCLPDGAVVFSVWYEDDDEPIHTDEHLFCSELDCMCHEDQERIACLDAWVQDGLMTAEQRDRYFRGQSF
jgi:hypothetical protein